MGLAENIRSYQFERMSFLQQALYILRRLSKDESSVDQFGIELDIEEGVISKLLTFLRDMEWIKEENHHLWSITEKGGVWLHHVEDVIENK
jgi:hypothetical protein